MSSKKHYDKFNWDDVKTIDFEKTIRSTADRFKISTAELKGRLDAMSEDSFITICKLMVQSGEVNFDNIMQIFAIFKGIVEKINEIEKKVQKLETLNDYR